MRCVSMVLTVLACSATASAQDRVAELGPVEERPELGRFFEAAGVEGTFVLHDMAEGGVVVYDRARAETPYIPASTFKIPNSLIALETRVVTDPDKVMFKWNGTPWLVPDCNRDQNMRNALRLSCVPVYREIARRVGAEQMAKLVDAFDYGNEDIGGALDGFWLDGDLRITALQQIDFLRRFYRDELPAQNVNMDLVRDMLMVEQTSDYVIRAKTGWSQQDGDDLGWWVGWVERDGDAFLFAMNIDIAKDEDAKTRIPVTKAILAELGVL